MFPTVKLCLLLSLLVLMHEPISYSMYVYKVRDFYTKTIRYSCLLGDNHKFIANVRDNDHKITKIRRFVAYYKHSNVGTFEGSFECRTFVHALLRTSKLKNNACS